MNTIKKILLKIIEKIENGIFFSIGVFLVLGIVYATNISKVSNGGTLTAVKFNELIDQINTNTSNINNTSISGWGCDQCPGGFITKTYDSGNLLYSYCANWTQWQGSWVEGLTDKAVCEIRGDAFDDKYYLPGVGTTKDVGSNETIETAWVINFPSSVSIK